MVSDDEDEDFELHAAVAAVFLGGTPQIIGSQGCIVKSHIHIEGRAE